MTRKFSFIPKEMFKDRTDEIDIPIEIEEPVETRDWSLLPMRELGDVVDVLTHGAKKYSRFGWINVIKNNHDHYRNHLTNHLMEYLSGNLTELESGKSHLAHVICNALFLMWADNQESQCKK